jgi:DNA adenine methylase
MEKLGIRAPADDPGVLESPISPIFNWPGGKRWLAGALSEKFCDFQGTYYEPFVGGGAVYFHLRPQKALLSDTNAELINAYEVIRDSPRLLIKRLSSIKNNERTYYAVRASKPKSALGRAARLLYLTRLSFNGIHRVNLAGTFNVPYGYKTHLEACDSDRILRISAALQGVKLSVADFETATRGAKADSIVYFDPPYTVAHGHNGFLKYNENIFSWADQVRLALHAERLAETGCRVVISNADHESIRALYRKFKIQAVSRFSRIAASAGHRREISELVMTLPR